MNFELEPSFVGLVKYAFISVTDKLVISSTGTGGAALEHGGTLGQYQYDGAKGYYVQTSTDKDNAKYKARYLYTMDNQWHLNDSPGQRKGFLYNPTKGLNFPTSGWQHYKNGFENDRLLAINFGPVSLCREYKVSATGAAARKWLSYLGEFTLTDRWWRGRPTFINSKGRILYHGDGSDGWTIGNKFGKYVLRGFEGAQHDCPASQKNWKYWDGKKDKERV